MQSVSEDWDYSINGLATQFNDGVESIRSGIKELVDAGYITWTRHRDENGRVRGNDVYLHEIPVEHKSENTVEHKSENTVEHKSENTNSGKPQTGENGNNKEKTITKQRISNDNKLSLDTSENRNGVVQKSSYGNEQINEAFVWWREAFGYELKSSQQNRRAVYNMLRAKDKGELWVKQMLALLVEAKRDKYSGIHIANYADLQRDYEKLLAWGSARYEQKTSNDDEFERLVSEL